MMRPRTRTKLPIFLLLPSLSLGGSIVLGQAGEKKDDKAQSTNGSFLQFNARSDENAPADLKELRWMLSQIETEKGKKDPLADYVEKPSSLEERAKRSDWKEDDEAHATPKLFKPSANDYSSPNLQPNLALRKEKDNADTSNAARSSAVAPMQRARVESVYDSCYVPILKRAPISAKLVSSNTDRTSFQPEIPFTSQPATLPGLGNTGLPPFGGNAPVLPSPTISNPVLPNNGLGGTNNGFGGAAATVPTYNPAPNAPGNYSSPPPVGLGSPSSNPLINPSPSGYTNTPLSGAGNSLGGGVVMPAPPASYAPPNGLGTGGVQQPSYDSRPGIVNSQPFVSAPPCQKDARYMVSPTVYRQSVGCNSCGGQPYAPMSGGGSPFSYTPPTYFPGAFNGYASQYRPLIGLGQDVRQAQLGRGIIGQPVAYMPSQPLRNVLRYLFP